MILQEDKPQTLLLFSDENMAWLYEDAAFSRRWAELFSTVILKGNRVRIIHSISRDMNEMLEAVAKWIPIYMTGMIEPYYYPRLRDGVFQRTMFIAPETAAVISSSIQQNTEEMLSIFITDRAAVAALKKEYERFFTMCRPLMRVYSGSDSVKFLQTVDNLSASDGEAYYCSAVPPLFCIPERIITMISEKISCETLTVL